MAILTNLQIWSTALFFGDDPLQSDWKRPRKPDLLLSTRGLPFSVTDIHTIADPFLFAGEERLFLFAEVKRRGQPGRIFAWEVQEDRELVLHGEVDFGEGHLSYPFVFEEGGEVFAIPETGLPAWNSGLGEVALYRFTGLPTRVEKVAVLLSGPFADSSIYRHDGLYYLFTYREGDGLLFVGDRIEGPFRPHPANPISTDPRFSRGGGAVFAPTAGRPFPLRPAQDCSRTYGGDLSFMKIVELSPDRYREEPWVVSAIAGRYPWATKGAHHISSCQWQGRTVTALDGRCADSLGNRLQVTLARRAGGLASLAGWMPAVPTSADLSAQLFGLRGGVVHAGAKHQ